MYPQYLQSKVFKIKIYVVLTYEIPDTILQIIDFHLLYLLNYWI